MKDNAETLRAALLRLETSCRKIVNTRGYNKDSRALKSLEEMIKEQLTDANRRSAARKVR
jgi:hypothetical protein